MVVTVFSTITWQISLSGSNSGEVTPVPMPNTVVKLSSADGSWGFAPARVGRRQAILKAVRMFIRTAFLTLNIFILSLQTLPEIVKVNICKKPYKQMASVLLKRRLRPLLIRYIQQL